MYELYTGAPLKPARLNEVKSFLSNRALVMETEPDYTAVLYDEAGGIMATGSLCANVIKYIAVAEEAEGTGAAATIITDLVTHAVNAGKGKLFLFTKPANAAMFAGLGFYEIAHTNDALMMESKRGGIDAFLASVRREDFSGDVGAVVMNCNPLTKGHMHLIETARRMCGHLYIFVVSEDASLFSAEERFALVRAATAGMENVSVQQSSDYLVSKATFPTYFIKDRARLSDVQTDLDIAVFATRIAPALGIKKRFVGTEPFCPVTRAYNERMKELLPQRGIELIEIERHEGISASEVRRLMEKRDLAAIKKLVPEVTYENIRGKLGADA